MPQPKKKSRARHDQVNRKNDGATMFDTLLALDRTLVEVSMRRYKVSRRERLIIRMQQRRMHDVLRELGMGTSLSPAVDLATYAGAA